MTDRRTFLKGLLAASAAPGLSWADAGGPAFIACAQDPGGGFALAGLALDGATAFRVPLPARGHAGAAHPGRPLAIVFARRPGYYALVVDCVSGAVAARLAPPPGRQFNGHGVLIDGGARLVTSEQDAATSQGWLGLWSARDGWRRTGEIASGGIGPHDVRLMPDGRTLAVANGGIATDAADRRKLNLDVMRPNLAWIDPDSGVTAIAEPDPALRQNSIRHLAVHPDGTVAFAMQWEGDPALSPPLLGFGRQGGGALRLAAVPEAERAAMKGYAGSIAWNAAGTEVAITSPRGGRVQRFDAAGRFAGSFARADACGIAPFGAGFLLSDGGGGLIVLEGDGARPLSHADLAWDNHIVAL